MSYVRHTGRALCSAATRPCPPPVPVISVSFRGPGSMPDECNGTDEDKMASGAGFER